MVALCERAMALPPVRAAERRYSDDINTPLPCACRTALYALTRSLTRRLRLPVKVYLLRQQNYAWR